MVAEELKAKEKAAAEVDKDRAKAEAEEEEIAGRIEGAKSDIIEFINEGGNLKEKIARYEEDLLAPKAVIMVVSFVISGTVFIGLILYDISKLTKLKKRNDDN